ncbi:MAG: 5'-nucleotidase, lipoprotein e(P4) family [Flavobacteriales bacterium]
MKHTLIFLLAAAVIACTPSKTVVSTPPPPPPVSVDYAALIAREGMDAVLWQNASAEAYRIQQQGYELARLRLAENLRVTDKRPPAVIVDIDETVLDNSPYQVTAAGQGHTFDQATWLEWTNKARAAAIPGAVRFLKEAKALGCQVFYLSNRDAREKAGTLRNLDSLGFPDADEKHLLLSEGTSDKTARRARVAADHHVVLLIGDQLRDFDERFKDRSVNNGKDLVDSMADTLRQYFILLPNPMYGTYRDAVQGKGTDVEKHDRMQQWFNSNRY